MKRFTSLQLCVERKSVSCPLLCSHLCWRTPGTAARLHQGGVPARTPPARTWGRLCSSPIHTSNFSKSLRIRKTLNPTLYGAVENLSLPSPKAFVLVRTGARGLRSSGTAHLWGEAVVRGAVGLLESASGAGGVLREGSPREIKSGHVRLGLAETLGGSTTRERAGGL